MRFPEFHGEWEKCKVSDVLNFYSTNSLSWDQLEYGTDNMLNLHYGLIHVGLPTMVDLSKDILPAIKKENEPKNFELCKEGDIAFADASEDTNEVAKAIEFYTLEDKAVVCGLHTIHGRDKSNKTVVGYKGYAFSSTAFHHQIRRIAQGTKIYSISAKNFAECYIGIPSKEEQTKIAKLLRLIDERIATQSKLIEKLESLIKGICNNYFEKLSVQEEAYLIRLSDILKERNEYCCKDGKFIHGTLSKDGIFPKTGRWDRDFLVKQEDKKYKVTHLDDICYNPANLKFGVICRNTFGDLIFSPIYVTFEVCKNVNIGFIELYLTNHNFIEKVRRFEQGTVYERMAVSPEDFLSYKIRIPSYSDQTFFYKKVQWLIKLSQNEMKLLSQYKKLRQYLLREMFI
ncbi:restriction endonuclease subunit S [Segatella copri]|uniref:restriction endonuclease subunit S n=1 Tax=Segatella copri TaxID=165179 RepID=UPI001290FAB3|nr:restriction endonuclease subunit S [Segatella copri]MQN75203.1 restriction endonuclease subunit S [Segatella copri]MQO44382.1 restriction endonuclease subunit S [Segatella copri]MQO86783.1 restriction endonuclease subunit S [Segatella copri]